MGEGQDGGWERVGEAQRRQRGRRLHHRVERRVIPSIMCSRHSLSESFRRLTMINIHTERSFCMRTSDDHVAAAKLNAVQPVPQNLLIVGTFPRESREIRRWALILCPLPTSLLMLEVLGCKIHSVVIQYCRMFLGYSNARQPLTVGS